MERRTQWQAAWSLVATVGIGLIGTFMAASMSEPVRVAGLFVGAAALGVGLYVVFASFWDWWPTPRLPQSPEQPAGRTGIDMDRTNLKGRRVRIRDQDTGIRARRSEIDLQDSDID